MKLICSILVTAAMLSSLLSPAQDTVRVLFVGNSFTNFNNLPDVFRQLALGKGKFVITGMHAPDGVSVGDTAQGTLAHMNNPNLFDSIRLNHWDFLVLQDNQGRFI
jgi:hypothetical protein